jgi:hypothetical protein
MHACTAQESGFGVPAHAGVVLHSDHAPETHGGIEAGEGFEVLILRHRHGSTHVQFCCICLISGKLGNTFSEFWRILIINKM